LAALALLAFGGAAAADDPAPDTRAERLRRARQEKAKKPPHRYRPTFLERQILSFEKAERPSFLDVHYKGFWPTFASLASGSRVAPGIRFWEPTISGGPLSLHASGAVSVAGYQLFDAQVGFVPHTGDRLPHRSNRGDDVYELGSLQQHDMSRLILYGSFRFRRHPRERFFGLGGDSRREDLSNFLYQDATTELVAGWQLDRRTALTVRAGAMQVETGPGRHPGLPLVTDLFDDASVPGLTSEIDYVRTSAQLFVDRRDQPFNPHKGVMLALAAIRFDDRGGDGYGFDRVALDARGYVPLGSVQRVVAARAYVSVDDPHEGARVPFYMQEPLSNSHTLRGFETFRFRGEKLVSLQAEYRWEAAPALELAVFLDAGRAFRTGEDVEIAKLRTSWGGGLRLKTWNDTLFRLDVARSPEQTRAYARFGASF
jgi:hypothetical protein